MARVSRQATANKIVTDPNWDAFTHAAHASELESCRGVGASTATPALAVVDFGPTYLVGLLRATYSRATRYI